MPLARALLPRPPMMGVLVLLVIIAVACSCAGVMVMAHALTPRFDAPPPVPRASVSNPTRAERVRARRDRLRALVLELCRRGTWLAMAGALIVLPWLAIIAVLASAFGAGDAFRFEGGRALRVRRRVRLADRAVGDGWACDATALATVRVPDTDVAVGERWLAVARAEHASIAAFGQLGLHLATLGAPARLLAATHRAALDEIDHAERCFAIARKLSGVAHTAGPIRALGRRTRAIDVATLAVESLCDGCVGEGVAADVAALGATTATSPEIRTTLARIAEDERRHAALAWQLVAWCVQVGDEQVRRRLARSIDTLAERARHATPADTLAPEVLEAYGLVPASVVTVTAARRVAEVQAQARALLAPGARLAA